MRMSLRSIGPAANRCSAIRAICFSYLSRKHLVELLKTINNEVKPQKIVVIAHSLGCRLVCLALQQLHADPEAGNLKLDQVVFLAPNVDREEFDRDFKSELEASVNRLTIYVASDDNVLLLGQDANHNARWDRLREMSNVYAPILSHRWTW